MNAGSRNRISVLLPDQYTVLQLEVDPTVYVEVECGVETALKVPSSIEYKFPTLTSIIESSALFFQWGQ